MSDLYARMAETTLRQIDDKGRLVTLVKPNSGIYDPVNGTFGGGASVEIGVKALFTNYGQRDVDGDLIRSDDKLCLIAAASLSGEPTTADRVKQGLTEWAVVSVQTIQPGDTPLLFKVQVRR